MNIATDILTLDAWRERSGVVAFIRHGERESVPSHEFPRHDAPLTDRGRREAEAMGTVLVGRIGVVRSSPVPRCIDTAVAVLAGAKRPGVPDHDRSLGDPGAYVVDGEAAMSELVSLGFHPAARRLGEGEQLRGFADPDLATTHLIALARSLLHARPGELHLLVTHDLILSTMVARIRGSALAEAEWPHYLHGVAVWQSDGELMSRYGSVVCPVPQRLSRT